MALRSILGATRTSTPLVAARGIAVFAFDQHGFGLTVQDSEGDNFAGMN